MLSGDTGITKVDPLDSTDAAKTPRSPIPMKYSVAFALGAAKRGSLRAILPNDILRGPNVTVTGGKSPIRDRLIAVMGTRIELPIAVAATINKAPVTQALQDRDRILRERRSRSSSPSTRIANFQTGMCHDPTG